MYSNEENTEKVWETIQVITPLPKRVICGFTTLEQALADASVTEEQLRDLIARNPTIEEVSRKLNALSKILNEAANRIGVTPKQAPFAPSPYGDEGI